MSSDENISCYEHAAVTAEKEKKIGHLLTMTSTQLFLLLRAQKVFMNKFV
jgi:hypothetical protein